MRNDVPSFADGKDLLQELRSNTTLAQEALLRGCDCMEEGGMNVSTFERAQVARFAYEEARSTGSLDCMRAICYVLRNRLKNGWGDGTWLWLMENHVKVQGNERCTFGAISDGSPAVPAGITASLDPQDRLLQLIIRDIDDIYNDHNAGARQA